MEPEALDFTGLPGYQLFRCRVAIAGCFTGDLLSQVNYTPKQFLLLFASMLRVFMTMTALGNSW